jgi:hypothetical protein
MKNKLTLPSGQTYFTNSDGQRICTGSQMGRSNVLPEEPQSSVGKLRLERLRWVDGDYDQWGAYWGGGGGTDIYCAHGEVAPVLTKAGGFEPEPVLVFVRAADRDAAKTKVREVLPRAKFYH